jgi:hypothetical protein
MDRRFLHRAHAIAFAGYLDAPTQERLGVVAPAVLSETGLSYDSESPGFTHEYMSFSKASSSVSATYDEGAQTYLTKVSCIVENINVNGVLTAKKVVASLVSRYGAAADEGSFDVSGMVFEDLEINGVAINLNLDTSSPPSTYADLTSSPDLALKLASGEDLPGLGPRKLMCTLASFPSAPEGIQIDRNRIDVPNFGRIFFAQFMAAHGTRRLTMLHIVLGSPVAGTVDFAQADVNGEFHP